jgi:hypothetical protein
MRVEVIWFAVSPIAEDGSIPVGRACRTAHDDVRCDRLPGVDGAAPC